MSSWDVRQAEVEDKEWCLEQGAAFISHIGNLSVDMAHLSRLADTWLNDPSYYVLIAEHDKVRKGIAVAVMAPHFLDPSTTMFTELMWWVPVEHRNSRAGLLLFTALDAIGSRSADITAIATEHDSPLGLHALTKRGYTPQELTYIKRTPCPPSQQPH